MSWERRQIEPPQSPWQLPPADAAPEGMELVGAGGDLEPGTMLLGYRSGLFPMPLPEELRDDSTGIAPIGWWSPDPRAIIPLDGMHVSRSLSKSMRHFDIRIDTSFEEVLRACADPQRPHGWIDSDFCVAYLSLFELGWAHSIETWDKRDDELVGGLFGLSIDRLFAAESKFHYRTDASKAAVSGLVEHLRDTDHELLDVQWMTPHLSTLGAVEVSRNRYLQLLAQAVNTPARFAV